MPVRLAQFDPELCELFLRILDEEGEEMVSLLGESERPAAELGS